MVLSKAASENDLSVHSTFASRYVRVSLPRFKMPENSIPKDAAYQIINDELMLDGNPRLNLASFVTTWMEPECDKLIMDSINKNYVDMDEYPVTTELQNRCVNMIANLFNAPLGEGEAAVGVGTVGSSEAIMLAGLAFKRKWQKGMKAQGKPYDKPNIVTGANVQVCWEKFARYFEVELKEVKLEDGYYVMDPEKAVEMVDENTICVAAILGSTLNGEFEDVKRLNDLLVEKNKETGWDTPIHVDAASGGFIAPFLCPDLEWDFRLPLVKSINVSGHKYGLVYAGIGWVIWRSKEDLPEELIFHINYLGADQPTFTLNFSKGSSQVIAQYYQLIRLGYEGYKNVMENCQENARVLREGLEKTERFNIVSKEIGVPLVAFSLKDNSRHNEFEISDHLRRFGWIVPAYTMPPNAEHVTLLRVVIREDFSRTLAERLVNDIQKVLHELDMLPARVSAKLALAEESEREVHKKSAMEVQLEITNVWKKFVAEKKKTKNLVGSDSVEVSDRIDELTCYFCILERAKTHGLFFSFLHFHSSETYRFFDLPFCAPAHVTEKKEALGEVLNGDRLVSAPYKLDFMYDKDSEIVCKKKLSKEEVSQFCSAVAKDYYFQMYYDDLPIWGFLGKVDKDAKADPSEYKYYLFKHLHFEIFYNNDRVVEINAQTDPNSLVDITEDKEVDADFMYSVKWKETTTPFEKRMEKYSQSSSLPHHLEIHWFSIINSCVTVLLLTGFLATILMRVLKNDFVKYAHDEEAADDQEETGWKYIHGDVFRYLKYKSLLAAALGSGTQLFTLTIFIFILSLVGVFYPYNRGALFTALVVIYALTSGIAGYTASSFY
ncbi:hypothetical protein K7X08_030320 [Anisodus acutangulus]|uniref:Glutamate decarboxylase n=1 Tax=Anisodus acutangulus TaxID=402998 RepID=A0A9Q1R590_9SOLA|nr:hypothetical protein K7X08_030320 [Anisodus acutangulus]